MSGGSFDWLYEVQDLEDVQSKQFQLEAMAERLAGLGYAQDAARETEELLVLFRQWQTRVAVRVSRLADLWQAVEYWDSADRTEEAVHAALAKYRADTDAIPPP
ncbi:hypothetical protein [Streptomyces sp. NPDC020489]|uniref:hypothetical protein n=1 Tax=Streptomyces sp. NPDC020489 TaxID=3365077 RepID=UPI003788CC5E